MNAIPLINNIPKTNINNEKQLRQEINTSLVALKKEAGTLEGLINEAAQMLVTINNRIATLENDTVKKSDIVDVVQSGNLQPVTSNAVADKISSLDVSSVGGNGKYISAISETDGKINATASNLATSVVSGNTSPVTSEAVYNKIYGVRLTNENLNDITDSGMYYMNNASCTNAPSSAYESGTLNGILFVNQYGINTPNPNTYTQTIKVFRAGVPYIATRRKWNGGSWGDWYQETTVKYKVITATTNSHGEVPSSTIDLDYTKNMIIGINCGWDGIAASTYRDYKLLCNLGNKKYYVVVYDGYGTTVKNEGVMIRIAYIEI